MDQTSYTPAPRRGIRPPDLLVPALRRRTLLVHRPRPHQRRLRRAELHQDAARRHQDRGGRREGRLLGLQSGSFDKVTLDDNTANPMMTDIATDGTVFYIDRLGDLKIIKTTGSTVTAGHLNVFTANESGLLGLALDPDFDTNSWRYLYYSPASPKVDRLSRFTVNGDARPRQREGRPGRAGAAGRVLPPRRRHARSTPRPATCTWPPATTPTRSPPTATRRSTSGPAATRVRRAAQRRQHQRPARQAAAHPGREATARTPSRPATCSRRARPRPGRRSTRWASATRSASASTRRPAWSTWPTTAPTRAPRAPTRGPAGTGRVRTGSPRPGNYGWPYCTGNNTPYIDYNFATKDVGREVQLRRAGEHSPNNTGLTNAARGDPGRLDPTLRRRPELLPGVRRRRRVPDGRARSTATTPTCSRPSSSRPTATARRSSGSGTEQCISYPAQRGRQRPRSRSTRSWAP